MNKHLFTTILCYSCPSRLLNIAVIFGAVWTPRSFAMVFVGVHSGVGLFSTYYKNSLPYPWQKLCIYIWKKSCILFFTLGDFFPGRIFFKIKKFPNFFEISKWSDLSFLHRFIIFRGRPIWKWAWFWFIITKSIFYDFLKTGKMLWKIANQYLQTMNRPQNSAWYAEKMERNMTFPVVFVSAL